MNVRKMERRRLRFFLSGFLCLFAAAAAFPPRAGQETVRIGGTLRVRPFSDDIRPNLDPASGVWVFATEQIFDGLVAVDSNLTPVPSLAEYWMFEQDGRSMLFYLRKGSRFHNGREVTSDDVKFSFERLLRPDVGSPFYEYFASRVEGAREFRDGKAAEVSGFRALAPDVFEIRLTSPFAAALPILGMSFAKVLPRDLVREQGRSFFFRPVGTGAFMFESWLRSPRLDIVGVRLERNPRYFRKRPYVSVLEISPHFNDEHFRNRELDICPFRSEELAEAGAKILSIGPRSVTLVAMSCGNPPLDRPSVRRAIARALDKEALARSGESISLVRLATDNFVPPSWPGFFPRDAAAPERDKSRQVLEDQGFFLEKPFPPLLLFIPGGRDNRDNQLFAREAVRELGLIGIPAAVRTYQKLEELGDVRQPYLAKIDWALDVPDPEAVLRLLFHSRSDISRAVSGYAGAELDKLLEEAAAEKSATRRNELLRRAEAAVFEDVPAFPVTMNEQRIAVQPYVRNVRASPLGFAYLDAREIWLDKKEEDPR